MCHDCTQNISKECGTKQWSLSATIAYECRKIQSCKHARRLFEIFLDIGIKFGFGFLWGFRILPQNCRIVPQNLPNFATNRKVHISAGYNSAVAYLGCIQFRCRMSHVTGRSCAVTGVTDCSHRQNSTGSRCAFSVGGHALAHIFGPACIQDCGAWCNDCKLFFTQF